MESQQVSQLLEEAVSKF